MERIRVAEQLLAPSASLFAFLLSNDKQSLDTVVQRVRKAWGPALPGLDKKAIEAMEGDFLDATRDPESGRRWLGIAGSLAGGDYAKAIEFLLMRNREVMLARGGAAPWAEIRDGKLDAKFVAENADSLPTRPELSSHWIHPYFVDALRSVSLELGGHS